MKYDYDMIVIGGGAAGLTSAGLSAHLGAKTAIIEMKKLGGDCTWYGCIPSKALLKISKTAYEISSAKVYGISASSIKIDFDKIKKHIREIQEKIYNDADHPDIFTSMGIDVITGKASFNNENEIEVTYGDESKLLSSKYFIVASGSSPIIPEIKGIDKIKYYTNETIFSADNFPDKLLILGAGPIGVEMAQAFSRLGSKVSVVDKEKTILPHDDKELSQMLLEKLSTDEINFILNDEVAKFTKANSAILKSGKEIDFDSVLFAVGRKPNIAELSLRKAKVKYNSKGIVVDDYCRTSAKNIFAAGDCAGRFHFTHFAEHMAKKAVTTALLKLPSKIESDKIVWCTYTQPELAHAGLTEAEIKKIGKTYKTFEFPFEKIDRAAAEKNELGKIKVYASNLTGKIYGVDILGENAGEMAAEFSLAIKNNISLRKFSDTMHPYPTYLLGNRRAADQWYVDKIKKGGVKFIQKLFGYKGKLADELFKKKII